MAMVLRGSVQEFTTPGVVNSLPPAQPGDVLCHGPRRGASPLLRGARFSRARRWRWAIDLAAGRAFAAGSHFLQECHDVEVVAPGVRVGLARRHSDQWPRRFLGDNHATHWVDMVEIEDPRTTTLVGLEGLDGICVDALHLGQGFVPQTDGSGIDALDRIDRTSVRIAMVHAIAHLVIEAEIHHLAVSH